LSHALLVTTSFSFLKLEPDTGTISCLHRGEGLYYGITQSLDHVFVAARRRLVSSKRSADQEQGVILVFDKKLCYVRTVSAPFALRDMHEIHWHQGRLWITCSFDNMVAVFDGKTWEQWYPLGRTESGPLDRNHFNSFLFENQLIWVLAHNKGPSTLMAFDQKTRQMIQTLDLGIQAHNIWRQQKELLTCSSGDGKIVGTRGFSLETGGFPRGVAFLNRRRYVGRSEIAERKDRDFTSGTILVYDKKWRFQTQIELAKEGLILDMAPVEICGRPKWFWLHPVRAWARRMRHGSGADRPGAKKGL
jgi:hypothetical protein